MMEAKLRVGYSRVDITPEYSIPLQGYGNGDTRRSERVLDPVCVTCLALVDDAGERVLLYSVDLTCGCGKFADLRYRPAISRATSIAVDHIIIAGTHTHSGPDMECEFERAEQYRQFVEDALLRTANEALADCTPARLFTTSVQTEKLNFVRRYVLENGTYAGDNYGDFSSSPIAGHESEADRRVQLLKITREGKKDILLVHFQVHQSLTGGVVKKDLSADITGSLRMYLEPELDCQMIYFTGGAGNINPMSRIPEENLLKERDYLAYGRALSDYIVGAQGTYQELHGDKIRVRQRIITCKTNHAGDSKIEVATHLWNEFCRTDDWKTWNKEAIKAGLNSIFHAEAIIYNIALPPEKDIELNAISIGDVAFCMAPYELFDTTARQVMDPSPFPLTIMVTCCHDARDYIPSKLGYEHGGYSSDSSQFCCGTAEKMVENYHQMLDELNKLK